MGGACLKPAFCIRTQSGLTVQLHQIPPISMRLQGLYKHCSPHRDNAFTSFPLMVSGPTHAFLSKTLAHTFLYALCGIDLHLGLVQREADVRVKSQNSLSFPTTWANTARWTQFCNEDNTAIIKSSKKHTLNPKTCLLSHQPKLNFFLLPRWAFVCFFCFTVLRTAVERHETVASCLDAGLEPERSLPSVSYALNPFCPSGLLVPPGLPCPQ